MTLTALVPTEPKPDGRGDKKSIGWDSHRGEVSAPITFSAIVMSVFAKVHHQYSLRLARPLKVAYLRKKREMACGKVAPYNGALKSGCVVVTLQSYCRCAVFVEFAVGRSEPILKRRTPWWQ